MGDITVTMSVLYHLWITHLHLLPARPCIMDDLLGYYILSPALNKDEMFMYFFQVLAWRKCK